MNPSHSLQKFPTHTCFEIKGPWVFETAAEEMFKAIAHCNQTGKCKLLVDAREIELKPLSTYQRFWLGSEAAKHAAGAVRVAMVAPLVLIDPQKFAITVAANRNLTAEVFSSFDEAMTWLLADDSQK
jgi:hypothetical protein